MSTAVSKIQACLFVLGSLVSGAAWADSSCSADGEQTCSISCPDTIDPDSGQITHYGVANCVDGSHTTYNSDGSVLVQGVAGYCSCL